MVLFQTWFDCRGVSTHHIDVLSQNMKGCPLGVLILNFIGFFYFVIHQSKEKIHTLLLPQGDRISQKQSLLLQCSCMLHTVDILSFWIPRWYGWWPLWLWSRENDFGLDMKRFQREGSERRKKAKRHRLIVSETMRATFHWIQQRRHIPLFNWGPSYDPAVVWKHCSDSEVSSIFSMHLSIELFLWAKLKLNCIFLSALVYIAAL